MTLGLIPKEPNKVFTYAIKTYHNYLYEPQGKMTYGFALKVFKILNNIYEWQIFRKWLTKRKIKRRNQVNKPIT